MWGRGRGCRGSHYLPFIPSHPLLTDSLVHCFWLPRQSSYYFLHEHPCLLLHQSLTWIVPIPLTYLLPVVLLSHTKHTRTHTHTAHTHRYTVKKLQNPNNEAEGSDAYRAFEMRWDKIQDSDWMQKEWTNRDAKANKEQIVETMKV